MQLIPAIDLRGGQVVRLAQGDDARRTKYDVSPQEMLARYGAAGVELVHVVDLDAAFGDGSQRPLIEDLASRGARGDGPRIELGGGLRDRDAVAWALDAGCERVILGSLAARDFEAFAAIVEQFPDVVIPAVETAGGELRVAGWTEGVDLTLDAFCAKLRGLACPAALVTDVDRDGTLEGPNFELVRHVARASGLPALLSGGVHALGDLERAAEVEEIAGAIVGKAIYEGVFTLEDALAACRGAAS